MNEQIKKKRSNKFRGLILSAIALLGISSLYLIYNILLLSGIEDIIRISAIVFISILFLVFIVAGIKANKKSKLKAFIIFMITILLVTTLQFAGAYYINRVYSSISKMNKTEVTYGTSLITLKDYGIDDVADLKGKKIGLIKDTNSIEGYVISQEIIKDKGIDQKSLVEYDDFLSMINDLYEEQIDAIFISSGYVSMFGSIDRFENIKNDTKVLVSKNKTMAKQENSGSNVSAKITEPFTMLIMGIDSTEEDIKSATSFNGDSIILVTFNPKTLNATMLSIPRDTFVPIMCFKNHIQNKITHAAWYGESCMMSTIKNFTGIDIDYYVKINFKGVVKLVDALGGVEVNVPYNFCEQNSNREWGKNTVYVEKGLQTLNGEKALAFARNRHPNPKMCKKGYANYSSDDFVRGQNQQTIIKALMDKVKGIRDINKLYEILDLMEKSMDTNLSTNQILSFYNIGKNILAHTKTDSSILNFQKLYLKTYGTYIYDEGMKQELSDQIYYKGSLNDITEAMEINLGIKEPTIIKTFAFSINETYEEEVIGKGKYNEASIALVPNFTKHTRTTATTWGIKNDVLISFKTVVSSESKYVDGQIISQTVPTNSLVSIAKTKGITLTVISKTSTPITSDKINCTLEENENNSVCSIPDFEGEKLSVVDSWLSKITTSSIKADKIPVVTTDEEDDGKIFYQSKEAGTKLYGLTSGSVLDIKYYEYINPDTILPE